MTIRRATAAELPACLALRHQVFVQEQAVPAEEEVDAHDETALHLVALEAGRIIGTARIVLGQDSGKIGRVCVARSHRGRGFGAGLIRAALDELRARAIPRARLGAQLDAIGFYQRLGFAATGPVYDDAGIAHRDMVRDL